MPTSVMALLGLASLAAGFLLRLLVSGAAASAWVLMALGAALIVLAAVLDHRRVGGALASSRGRFGIGATVRVSLLIGIVIVANAIAAAIPYRLDVTGLAQFTLTSQTKDVLRRLNTPVEIVSFFTPGPTGPIETYAESLLAEYQNHSDRIVVRHVDPELSPDVAREYGVEQTGALVGVLVFTGKDGRKRVFGPEIMAEAEHAFTGAILEVTGTTQKQVLFLVGHGEARIEDDYAEARKGLRDNLFQVGELDLLATADIPLDAAAVVVAGPRQPLAAREIDSLSAYLGRGGHLLLLLDPDNRSGLEELLANWWLEQSNGRVIDPAAHVEPAEDNVLVDRTRNIFGIPQVNFPGAAAIIPKAGMPESLDLSPIAWTGGGSRLSNGAGTDRTGSFALGALVSVKPGQIATAESEMRLAVIGDSDFAASAHFASANNGDLFVTIVNWLTADASVISVDRKAFTVRRLVLTPEQARFLHAVSIGLFPSLLFIGAGMAWWRRR